MAGARWPVSISLGILLLATGAVSAQTPPSPAAPQLKPVTGFVSSFEIMRTVREAGFDPLVPPLREGSTYVLRATDFRGILMRVVLDARTGTIRDVTRIVPANAEDLGAAPPYEAPPGYADSPYGEPVGLAPPAPRVGPAAPPPTVAHPAAATHKTTPPLPRPRPAALAVQKSSSPGAVATSGQPKVERGKSASVGANPVTAAPKTTPLPFND